MQKRVLELPEVVLYTPRRFGDDRGYFSEVYNDRTLSDYGLDATFVQDNHSYSKQKGTVRGLHYQSPPHAQGKLVRVAVGAILDVVVDVRSGSPNFGRSVSAELSAENGEQLWVPTGFLHGFVTLCDDTEVIYKVTDYYSKDCDGSVFWADPDLAIDWGVAPGEAVLSAKDADAVAWKDFQTPFTYA